MKNLLFALIAILLVASVSMAQPGWSKLAGGTQGVKSGMVGGPHDFTKTNYTGDTTVRSFKGPSNSLCSYCHAAHTPADAIPTPLWSRASITDAAVPGGTYGTYTSIQMDATPAEVSASDNYSSYCMGCHDGSAAFAASKYTKTPYISGAVWPGTAVGFDTLTVSHAANLSVNGEYGGLSHIHPVNFSYADAAATDGGLWPMVADQDYMVADATYGTVGRLFGGTVQCSSCHNPHANNKGILLQGSNNYGALCVACHKK